MLAVTLSLKQISEETLRYVFQHDDIKASLGYQTPSMSFYVNESDLPLE